MIFKTFSFIFEELFSLRVNLTYLKTKRRVSTLCVFKKLRTIASKDP